MRCPMCYGAPTLLGELGRHRWFRCRDCGWDWTDDEGEDDDDQ